MKRALPLAVAGLSAVATTFAAVPAKNLGFESWDSRARPEAWHVPPSKAFTVSPDCTAARQGGCTLRISGKATGQELSLPLSQPMGATGSAGHRLRLSGWMRTEAVEGWAGLWLRADVEGKVLALENMRRDGPRGTTPWGRFEVAIDVPANATLISLGVLLSGNGTAWFDDLALAVDPAVKVGKALKSEVIFPPRPVPSHEHVPDRSLHLPASEVPGASASLVQGARAAARPIRSLMSEDFSDLEFLKPLLAGKRIVQLGESAHGIAEFNWLKVRLVKFLHREMGFDVVAFESSLSACYLADARVGRAAPVDVMREAIFPVWHSTETLELFEYLDRERAAGRALTLAGFDVQNNRSALAAVSRELVRQVARVDETLARRIEAFEREIASTNPPRRAADMAAAYRQAAERLAAERRALRALEPGRPEVVDVAIQELRSRVRLVEQMSQPGAEGGKPRDAGMAGNLEFLLETLYPGRKVIVWAHNGHVGRFPAGTRYEDFMGSLVAARRGAQAYTIGFYMGWGIGATNDRRRYEIERARAGSLEAVLANAGWRLAYFDLSTGSWARTPLEAREWGVHRLPIVPASVYDALIYVDSVTPPEYL